MSERSLSYDEPTITKVNAAADSCQALRGLCLFAHVGTHTSSSWSQLDSRPTPPPPGRLSSVFSAHAAQRACCRCSMTSHHGVGHDGSNGRESLLIPEASSLPPHTQRRDDLRDPELCCLGYKPV